MNKLSSVFTALPKINLPSASSIKTKAFAVAVGVLTTLPVASSHRKILALDLSHIAEEITNHAFWHHVGHVLHLGTFAAGLLGGLLSFQSLGEQDSFYLERPLNSPRVSKCFDPREGKEVPCIILSNGQKIVGKDLFVFLEGLRRVQLKSKS